MGKQQTRKSWVAKSGRKPKEPDPSEAHCGMDDTGGMGHQAIWALYARVKYWTAANRGPRTKPEVPSEAVLQALAERFRDVLDETWRAGWRGEDLSRMLYRVLKEDRDGPRPTP